MNTVLRTVAATVLSVIGVFALVYTTSVRFSEPELSETMLLIRTWHVGVPGLLAFYVAGAIIAWPIGRKKP